MAFKSLLSYSFLTTRQRQYVSRWQYSQPWRLRFYWFT